MMNQQAWNVFSRSYVTYVEQIYYPSVQVLYDQLSIEKATKVLEGINFFFLHYALLVGTGGGYYLKNFIIQKPLTCQWYATDFCEVMLQICSQRIKEFQDNPLLKFTNQIFLRFELKEHDYLTEEFPPFKDQYFDKLSLTISKADASDLSQYPENSFDRYFANQVLNGPNRDIILKEAFRVLKEEGLLGITVFGRRENCNCMTIFKEIGIEQGMNPQKFPEKDEFSCTQKDLVLSQIEKAGFTLSDAFYISFPLYNGDKAIEHLSNKQGLIRKQLEQAGADENMIEKIKIALKVKVQEIHEKTKCPLMMEVLYVIASKQKQ